MKPFHYIALATIGTAFGLSSCEKVLDKENLGQSTTELVFKDSTLANLNLSFIYNQNLPEWGDPIINATLNTANNTASNFNVAGLTEEAYSANRLLAGTLLVSDVGGEFGTGLSATNNYGKIRTINMFLSNVKNGPLPSGAKGRLRGQAQFFRAWRYFEMVRQYGGVPLVMSPLNGVGQEARDLAYIPRNTTNETFAAIVADLDSAIQTLPGKWTSNSDWGRINKGTAMALKGRVLVYAASPQFTTADKWQAAYDANVQAKATLLANGYRLHASFDQLWFQEVNNPEAVMVTSYNTSTGDQLKRNNQYDNSTRPAVNGTGGGQNQPTWEMVQAFPMLDGKKRTETGRYTYSDQLFYKNRDPRFDKTIAYNGCTWPLNGNTGYRLWTYLRGSTSVESGSATNTGFYCRKAINPSASPSEVQYLGTDWIEIRYAEVLLNLAESACGVNRLTEAYTELKAIRQRAGIEPGSDGNYGLKANMTRAEMFDAILYERQLELAFEGKRFWDLRRWRKMETLNGLKRTGRTITLNASAPSDFATTRDNLNLDQVYTNYFTIAPKALEAAPISTTGIKWDAKYYFFPIPQAAIDNNPQVQQNKDWGGSFDPMQ
ncbi:RagB/SusD family nutrient uptake outer membrane protein [Hymenobacter properus]|uniref:RagB/SusD family nutrient uptake outer membrane protein n=1 Tax=Hymenobacter properus TaxID=2791026 RepID=A0A931FHH9_9BACT|nr:RagB/SusD family nutrient uptake outer membrane protein [Hymenobacter properus]MBF9141087.1 RagB/SusD family nutrient uptake outer membrane protein [Hymenobacter properus]MBR7719896.1 RagB/SusD family nutrient uptake outer membrane protein [Microvirga sp. SRT04]